MSGEENAFDKNMTDEAGQAVGTAMSVGEGKTIDITGDGGVLKEVLVEGTGDEMPQKDDEVYVHYIGTLQSDGSKFDSSRDKDTPFSFKLGKGRVIKGWDAGVATMKRGEKALFTIRSDYGYGESGSGDKIPGGATLLFEVELLRWNEKDVTNDGGVFFKELEKGTGWKHPEKHDEIFVKYQGRLNGVTFTASINNDFELITLGAPTCPLPSGVERAICSELKKGGKGMVTCRPEYAFGDAGLEDKVPPGATVEYEVELKDWNAVHEIVKDGITVKLLGQTESYGTMCNDAAKVTLTVEGKVLPDGPVFLGPTEKTLTVGDGEMPEGLERGLEKVKKGQPAFIICQPQYAYGDAGNAELGVPPNAQVQFHVTPTSVQATYELDLADKISAAERRKQQGNTFYLAADLERAMTKYEKAYSLIEHEKVRDNKTDGDEGNRSKLQDLKMALHLNKAAVFEKQGRLQDLIDECKKALESHPRNVKALFRRGKAYNALNKLDEASTDLKLALEQEADNTAVKKELALVRQKQKQQNEKDKTVFGRMFSKPGACEATKMTKKNVSQKIESDDTKMEVESKENETDRT